MCQTSLSVWFVCRLCRGSFGQVDAFIEHKKQKHFTQFQNTTSIVFEEIEQGPLSPAITNNTDHPLAGEINKQLIKVETNEGEPFIPLSSEMIDEQNLDRVEPKSELITYESKIIPDNENSFLGLKQPEKNPYVLLKRLTSEEIQNACVPKHHSTLLKCEQKNLPQRSESHYLFDTSSYNIDHTEVEKCTENQSTVNVIISPERGPQYECKLCSKQLESDGQLKIHVGICALYHKDRNRFCVPCNRKFAASHGLRNHRLAFHGTEEEKSSLFKCKCHVCPKKYRTAIDLTLHLESHKNKKEKQVETSKPKPLMCSHLNCGKAFRCNTELQSHIAFVHLGVRPFSCTFPNCNKSFPHRSSLNSHLRIHTGERPFKCSVVNCNEGFITSYKRSVHHQYVHCNL